MRSTLVHIPWNIYKMPFCLLCYRLMVYRGCKQCSTRDSVPFIMSLVKSWYHCKQVFPVFLGAQGRFSRIVKGVLFSFQLESVNSAFAGYSCRWQNYQYSNFRVWSCRAEIRTPAYVSIHNRKAFCKNRIEEQNGKKVCVDLFKIFYFGLNHEFLHISGSAKLKCGYFTFLQQAH